MNVLSLLKTARASSPLNFPSLFKSLGVEAEITELDNAQWAEAFQSAARSTLAPGASVVQMETTLPDGAKMVALMVMVPGTGTNAVTKDSRKTLDALPAPL